jgi:hypothetical protein
MVKYILLTFIFLSLFGHSFAQEPKLVLTSRWFHPIGPSDKLNTMSTLKRLNIKKLDWMYAEDPSDLRKLTAENVQFSLAIHPEIPDSSGYTSKRNKIVDIKGRPYVASWMKGWKNPPHWGCVNDPVFKTLFYNKSTTYMKLGAYGLFVDDALFNVQLQQEKPNQFGCFCSYCLQSFKAFLKSNNKKTLSVLSAAALKKKLDDAIGQEPISLASKDLLNLYQVNQEKSVLKFLNEWRASIKSSYPKVKLLANNHSAKWNNIYSVFDGGIAELFRKDLNRDYLDKVYLKADQLRKTQTLSLVSSENGVQFWLMAYNYVNNREILVPWDLYVPQKRDPLYRHFVDLDSLTSFLDFIKQFKLATFSEINKVNGMIAIDDKNCLFLKSKTKNLYLVLSLNVNENKMKDRFLPAKDKINVPGYSGDAMSAYYVR